MTKNNFKKNCFCLLLLGTVFFAHPSSAAAESKGVDQRCFTKKQCQDTRKQFGANTNEDGFVTGKIETNEACPGQSVTGDALGFCLPPGKTKTAVSFGGRSDFENMGDFIQYAYRYGIILAAVLAILMIVVAGLQWTASGGNSSTIESAKKRITGSITGLILAASSYLILNTISPSTVNLRLPQTWMVNSIGIAPENCTEAPDGAGIKLALSKEDSVLETSEEIRKTNLSGGKFEPKTPNSTYDCGNEYFVEGSGNITCKGSMCPPGNVCFQDPNAATPECVPGNIAGIISNSDLADQSIIIAAANGGNKWAYPWVKEFTKILGVCSTGKLVDMNPTKYLKNAPKQTQVYRLGINPEQIAYTRKQCDISNASYINQLVYKVTGGDTAFILKGFVLQVEINEAGEANLGAISGSEKHYLGRTGHEAVDLGDSQYFDPDRNVPQNIKREYLFTPEELTNGITLNINAAKIHDMDNGGLGSLGCLTDFVTYGATGICNSQAQKAAAEYKQNYDYLIQR